jgi:hypothetical protein
MHLYFMQASIILVVFILFSLAGSSQNKTPDSAMAYVDISEGYVYIPKWALDDKFDAVLIVSKGSDISSQRKEFKLWWNSSCNDGYYNLDVTPRQIYFSSSHDNPNPNYLYWAIDIDSIQYTEIAKGLQSKTPKGFSNLSKYYDDAYVFHDDKFKDSFTIPDEWTGPKEKEFAVYCQKQLEQQLSKYFSILNSFIKEEDKKIKLPSKKRYR